MNNILLCSLTQTFPGMTSNDIGATILKVGAITGGFIIIFFGIFFLAVVKKSRNRQQQAPKVGLESPRPELQFPEYPYNYGISVVLPAYNEEAVIKDTIQQVSQTLSALVRDFEILVVNDGSKDKTADKVRQLISYYPHLSLVQHEANQGCGAALISGFTRASKEYTFYMDSDGQFDIRELVNFLPLLQKYDGVFGYRIQRHDHWIRRLNGWGWNQIMRFMFGIHVKDVYCAFKIFRTEYFRRTSLEASSALLITEAVYKFIQAGYSYTEVGINHYPRKSGSSTGNKPASILRAFYELFVYAQQWHRQEFQEHEKAQRFKDFTSPVSEQGAL